MKLLLYCTKGKPYLYRPYELDCFPFDEASRFYLGNEPLVGIDEIYNGKIAAKCDFEVEKITFRNGYIYETDGLFGRELQQASYLPFNEMHKYLKGKNGYAIHIKNLHIFGEPKELSEYLQSNLPNPKHIKFANWKANYYWALGDYAIKNPQMTCKQLDETFNNSISIKKAPQNMMIVYDRFGNKYVLISIRPEWLCKELNGEKTIEVRKKILKEMMK